LFPDFSQFPKDAYVDAIYSTTTMEYEWQNKFLPDHLKTVSADLWAQNYPSANQTCVTTRVAKGGKLEDAPCPESVQPLNYNMLVEV